MDDISLLQSSELDLRAAIHDTHGEIDDRVLILGELLDQLRADRAAQLRWQRARAAQLDFLVSVQDTFAPDIAAAVDAEEAAHVRH